MTKRDLKTFSKYKVVQSLAEKIQLLQGLGSQLDPTEKATIPITLNLKIYAFVVTVATPRYHNKHTSNTFP